MAKQYTGANCSTCDYWNREYTAPNPDFHYCMHLEMFTRNTFYCSDHYSAEEFNYSEDDNV